MNLLFVSLIAFSLYYCALAKPLVNIRQYVNERNDDSFHFGYEQDDEQSRSETGRFVDKDGNIVLEVDGHYSYATDGKTYAVSYTADENGYRAKSSQVEVSAPAQRGSRIGSKALAVLVGGGLG